MVPYHLTWRGPMEKMTGSMAGKESMAGNMPGNEKVVNNEI
jgi:hypothetical protein